MYTWPGRTYVLYRYVHPLSLGSSQNCTDPAGSVVVSSHAASTLRSPEDHIDIRISNSGSKAQDLLLCRILLFVWSCWALTLAVSTLRSMGE